MRIKAFHFGGLAHRPGGLTILIVSLSLLLLLPARAAPATQGDPRLIAAGLFGLPEAAVELSRFEGSPPAAEVRENGRLVGYLVSSWDTIGSVGYSGKPLDVWLGIDLQAQVVGAKLMAHEEPILVIGVLPEDLERYVAGFSGLDLHTGSIGSSAERGLGLPDVVSGASVSSAVIRDAIVRAGRAVATTRGLFAKANGQSGLDRTTYRPAGWADLLSEGAVVSRRIEWAEAARATGAAMQDDPAGLFIQLFLALATPPTVGQNLIGRGAYESLVASMAPNDNLILVAADGLYSFKGTAYRKTGFFERIEIRQNDKTIKLTADNYRNLERLAPDDAPEFREIGIFVVPDASGFDPLRPWRLSLLVAPDSGSDAAVATFDLRYQVPSTYMTAAPDEAATAGQVPLWQAAWTSRIWEVAVLCLMLTVLAAILVFQDSLARRYRLYRWVRLSFLGFTLVWLGWIAGAQLSVVNVLTFAQALLTGFQWELFLLDPLIFILWGFVAVGLLFWGRGVFCGWLCPFGALQELLNLASQRLRVPQLQIPFALHERLWPIKYIIFLGLFAVSLNSVSLAFQGAEVEPFKTAITLKFVRHWPFVVYALALLIAGLFVQRFFCRYLCPLGAALAIPARLRMFEWLKRRVQCGRECRICAVRCPVQAIHPLGQINPNECIHCLNCQTLYFDATTCPPLVARAQRRQRPKPGLATAGSAAQGVTDES